MTTKKQALQPCRFSLLWKSEGWEKAATEVKLHTLKQHLRISIHPSSVWNYAALIQTLELQTLLHFHSCFDL